MFLDRPKSAMLQAVQDKVFSLMAPQDEEDTEEEDSGSDEDGAVETDMIAHQGEDVNIEDDKVSNGLTSVLIKSLDVNDD